MSTKPLSLIVAIVTFVAGTTITLAWRNHDQRSEVATASITQPTSRALTPLSVRIKEQVNVPLRLESLTTDPEEIEAGNIDLAYTNIAAKPITDYVIDCDREFE